MLSMYKVKSSGPRMEPCGTPSLMVRQRDWYQPLILSVSPGYPDPEVVWYKDDQPIKETRHFQIDYDEEGKCSLVISEVRG